MVTRERSVREQTPSFRDGDLGSIPGSRSMLRPNVMGQPWYPFCPVVPWRLDFDADLLRPPVTDTRYLAMWPADLREVLPDADGRFCRWCGSTDLPPRRSAWCSEWCHIALLANHFWGDAKSAMRNGSHACVECGEPFAVHRSARSVRCVGEYAVGCSRG